MFQSKKITCIHNRELFSFFCQKYFLKKNASEIGPHFNLSLHLVLHQKRTCVYIHISIVAERRKCQQHKHDFQIARLLNSEINPYLNKNPTQIQWVNVNSMPKEDKSSKPFRTIHPLSRYLLIPTHPLICVVMSDPSFCTTIIQIKLDLAIDEVSSGQYDASNALILPSKKRDSKVRKDPNATTNVTRILSKKQRKNLEKIVDKKKKKEQRSGLLERLASVQLPADELRRYVSITNVQTKGLKKHLLEQRKDVVYEVSEDTQQKWSSVAGGSKRMKRLALLHGYIDEGDAADDDDANVIVKDLNVIGVDAEASDSSDEDDDDEEEECNEANKEEIILEKDDDAKVADTVAEAPAVVEKKPFRRTVYVHVDRSKDIQAARLKLPILSEEQVIMETINDNSIIILAGETGSGKTTQVPQFLYEAGYAEGGRLIGITEPRRVAAISMSKRVAVEMNVGNDIVSYLIRFEGNVTAATRIKFMTDGVLLKEIENDFVLAKYSVIILDEAHERSVYTDILVGLLSRIVRLRAKRGDPLKLIIMSATLRVEDFTNNTKLFRQPPPVLKVETRQYPVTVHFNKRTSSDYTRDAYAKAVKIHNKLPEGGILIFLTGQQEVNFVVRKLRKAFPYRGGGYVKAAAADDGDGEVTARYSDSDDSDDFDIRKAIRNSKKSKRKFQSQLTVALPKISLDDYKLPTDDTEADLHDVDSHADDDDDESSSDNDDDEDGGVSMKNSQPLWVLPLYSLLPSDKQARVFDAPPPGTRLCVVTTNVAETSLTIPNIKYVIDSGRQKTRLYDKVTGVSSFVVTYTSKAAANQRSGRAGRTAPGHSYRLYSSAVYEQEFEAFAQPDIQRKPIEDLVLQMKCMGIDRVPNFPFPSPPDRVQLEVAEERLRLLGALEQTATEGVTKVTALGHAMAAFPVAPRFGKMLALSHQQNLLPYTVCMVAALSVQEVLTEVAPKAANDDDDQPAGAAQHSKWTAKRKAWAGTGQSLLLGDPVVLLRAVGAAEFAGAAGRLVDFCRDNGLRHKAVTEIRKLRVQLTNEINLAMPDVRLAVDPRMQPPTDVQAKLLRQILLAGMGDQVARRCSDDEMKTKEDRARLKYAYRVPDMEEPVFMHSQSVLRKSLPEWVCYQEVYELQQGDGRKMFMRGLTAVEPEWLLSYVRGLCNVRAIKEEPVPRYSQTDGKIYCYVDATFGRSGWEIPMAEMEMPLGEMACRWFAMFLLDGEVMPALQAYRKQLRSSPKTVVKTWAKATPHILNFVNSLLRAQVHRRQQLLDVWAKDPNCKCDQNKNGLF